MSKRVKHVLNVSQRTGRGGSLALRLRREGLIPAVVYCKGSAGRSISLKASEWESLSKYELNLVSLQQEGSEEIRALIKEVQKDFVKGKAIHIDFQEVKKDEVISATVAVHPGHVPPVGLVQGGILGQELYEITVSCIPDLLPESIEVDVSKLELGQSVCIRNLVLPEGVKALGNPDHIVFHVELPSVEEEVKPAEGAEAAAAEPEIVGAKEKAEKEAAEKAAEEEKKK